MCTQGMRGVLMNKFKYAAGITILLLCFQNCGTEYGITQKVSSDAGSTLNTSGDPTNPPTDPPTNPPTTPPPTAKGYVQDQQDFMSQTALKEVDIIWVIDNSRSMTEEASHVRNNFEKFIKQLESQVDIKTALISTTRKSSYETQVSLPASAKLNGNNLEIDYFVDSYNATLLAVAASCRTTDVTGICATLRSNSRYSRVMGSLNSFLRPNSNKVFIFVTDDDATPNTRAGIQIDQYPNAEPQYIENITLVENSHYISYNTFMSRMETLLDSPYRVFGFVATKSKDNSSCEITRESKTYKTLISQRNGTAYDICQSDWTSYFNQLVEKIYLYAQTDYVINKVSNTDFKGIVSVKLNGTVLRLNIDYTVQGKQISINESLLNISGAYKIEVVFEKWVY